ncbi:MAG: hypothetical protein H7A21_05630 [Spirochaetales bacterium]|nr:hypothetical protein [Leptospiraceae bacterium]MCP5480894.1 hypothetical protein [Spirochaetales bacterium]MCP5485274.1 hypothetical protein [Spirochaetales bacterium]
MPHPALRYVLLLKITLTFLLWALPLLFVPAWLADRLQLPFAQPEIFGRLLGAAYLALNLGYMLGYAEFSRGLVPTNAILVGILSNGLAALLLLAFGAAGAYDGMHAPGQLLMWVSAAATTLITIGLLLTGFSAAVRALRK